MWRLNLYNTNIDFLRWRKLAMGWSIAVLLIAIGSLLIRGMNLGLDFTGGTVIEVQYRNRWRSPWCAKPWPKPVSAMPRLSISALPRMC